MCTSICSIHANKSRNKFENLPSEANNLSVLQQSPNLLCNSKVHFQVHRSPLLSPNEDSNLLPLLFKIYSSVILPSRLELPAGDVPSDFSSLSCVLHVPPILYSLIRWSEYYGKATKYGAPHYARHWHPWLSPPWIKWKFNKTIRSIPKTEAQVRSTRSLPLWHDFHEC